MEAALFAGTQRVKGQNQRPQITLIPWTIVTERLVYNIPAKMIDDYRGRRVIVRSSSPSEILYCLWRTDPAAIRFIQLLSADADVSTLVGAGESIPIEIALKDPNQFQRLYDFTNLLDNHPVRIVIPVVSGFSSAAKLAVSLNYAVRLEMDQPDESLFEEIESVLDLYLHRSYVRQPIEFFQSLLLSLYRNEPVSVWDIAEENPKHIRYITDAGEETVSRRFDGVKIAGSVTGFIESFAQDLIDERGECSSCEFFNRCHGYFKWPKKDYSCDGVKRIFRTLATATNEVHRDLGDQLEQSLQHHS